jgi:hypothetical protein
MRESPFNENLCDRRPGGLDAAIVKLILMPGPAPKLKVFKEAHRSRPVCSLESSCQLLPMMLPAVMASITRLRLKVPGFWLGGNSRKLASHGAT